MYNPKFNYKNSNSGYQLSQHSRIRGQLGYSPQHLIVENALRAKKAQNIKDTELELLPLPKYRSSSFYNAGYSFIPSRNLNLHMDINSHNHSKDDIIFNDIYRHSVSLKTDIAASLLSKWDTVVSPYTRYTSFAVNDVDLRSQSNMSKSKLDGLNTGVDLKWSPDFNNTTLNSKIEYGKTYNRTRNLVSTEKFGLLGARKKVAKKVWISGYTSYLVVSQSPSNYKDERSHSNINTEYAFSKSSTFLCSLEYVKHLDRPDSGNNFTTHFGINKYGLKQSMTDNIVIIPQIGYFRGFSSQVYDHVFHEVEVSYQQTTSFNKKIDKIDTTYKTSIDYYLGYRSHSLTRDLYDISPEPFSSVYGGIKFFW